MDSSIEENAPLSMIQEDQEYHRKLSTLYIDHSPSSNTSKESPQYLSSPTITPTSQALSLPVIETPKLGDLKKRKRGRPPLAKDSRLCSNCGTSETPEWRKGPLGPHTLCNACGLQWMKAQKREHDMRAKYDEVRKKNSLMRVLNAHPNPFHSNVNTIHIVDSTPSTTNHNNCNITAHPHPMASSGYVEISESDLHRYQGDIDTISDITNTPHNSPPITSTPVTLDVMNTLKAMQTINALGHLNHMNHINTLNHINIVTALNNTHDMSNNNTNFAAYHNNNNTIVNQYNTNLNTFNTNNTFHFASGLPATPMARFNHLNPQQIFLPMTQYNNSFPSSPSPSHPMHIPFNSYLQPVMASKEAYTSPPSTFANADSSSTTNSDEYPIIGGGGQM